MAVADQIRRPRWLFVACLAFSVLWAGRAAGRLDKETRERFYGSPAGEAVPHAAGKGDSIANIFDQVLEKEFNEGDQPEWPDSSSFYSSVADQQDNIFIMSNRKSKYPVFQVDLRFISDLVVVIVSAAIGGTTFSCLGQPVIVGYLLAGSIIGPGGLSFISEMVQVETVAQFGVVFLLFALGLEFSLTKLKAVGHVAVLGGLLQIVIFMCLCGVTATKMQTCLLMQLCGAKLSEGIFVGTFLSMSSTAVIMASYHL